MLGYPHDPAQPRCAFGHLTSGGTVANYQALRLALALKAFPVALSSAKVPGLALPDDDWQAFNRMPEQGIALLLAWQQWLREQPPMQRRHWQQRVEDRRLEQFGLADFMNTHAQLKVPRVWHRSRRTTHGARA